MLLSFRLFFCFRSKFLAYFFPSNFFFVHYALDFFFFFLTECEFSFQKKKTTLEPAPISAHHARWMMCGTRNTFSLYPFSIANNPGQLCTQHSHASTYLVITNCLTYYPLANKHIVKIKLMIDELTIIESYKDSS